MRCGNDPYAELEAALAPLREAQPGITHQEVAPLLPAHLRRQLWTRAVERHLHERETQPRRFRASGALPSREEGPR